MWEALKAEDDENEEISVRICVKKVPRNTSMHVPPERRYWRKFSVMLPSVDESWIACEKNTAAQDAEELKKNKGLCCSWHV